MKNTKVNWCVLCKFIRFSSYEKTRTVLAVLRMVEIYPVLSYKLNKWQIEPKLLGIIDFNRFVEMLSGPELFLSFNFLSASFMISGVIFAKTKFISVFLRDNQGSFC